MLVQHSLGERKEIRVRLGPEKKNSGTTRPEVADNEYCPGSSRPVKSGEQARPGPNNLEENLPYPVPPDWTDSVFGMSFSGHNRNNFMAIHLNLL